MKIARVFKIGGSWTVAIPRRYFQDHNINTGDYVKVKNKYKGIEIEKLNYTKEKGR